MDQRKADKLPASRWVHSRHYGEKFNEYLRAHGSRYFQSLRIKAAAPAITEGFGYREYKKNSGWLQTGPSGTRHLSRTWNIRPFQTAFITERGKAVRIGSVIINAKIKPDTRKNTSHTANCLWYAKGTCGACIKRCPVDAITAKGHDKKACFDYIRDVTAPYAKEILGAYETPCGLCQVKIPLRKTQPGFRLSHKPLQI